MYIQYCICINGYIFQSTSQNEIAARQDSKLSTENANTLYQVYKDEANRHYNLRKECLNKANDAFRRGLPQVASYYSQVVSVQLLFI